MSLAALVLRNLTVAALLDATLAGKNVSSSDILPINGIKPSTTVPIIAVFTDHAKADSIDGNDLIGAQLEQTLAIEIACINAAPDADDSGVDLPETDEGMEMALDVIQRQAIAILQTSESVMARLWRACAFKLCSISVIRGAAVDSGTRFAARRIEIGVQTVADPYPGQPLPKFWTDVIAAFAAVPTLTKIATLITDVASGAILPPWKQWRNELGLNDEAMTSIGVGPLDGVVDGAGAVIGAAELSGEGNAATIAVDAEQATITTDANPDQPVPLVE